MNIALIGYGRMGLEVERLALEDGHEIVLRLTSASPAPNASDVERVQVAIHFAHAISVVDHVRRWSAWKKPLVIGTTGWQDHLDEVRNTVRSAGTGLVYASNFSIGVNAFQHLLRAAGQIFNRLPAYDVFIHEAHHKDKADSPSGTALTLGNILLGLLERKKSLLTTAPEGAIKPDQLHISSSRAGAIVGMHRVVFDSSADQIELTHTAKNRSGFAAGALLAAQWIQRKQGMFTMEDVVRDLFQP